MYAVDDDQQWHWVGAVTLGKDPIDGMIRRIVLRGTRLYALVNGQGKGLQVIDLPTVRDLFQAKTGGAEGAGFFDLVQSIGTEGRGFGETSIVQTVFIDTGTGLNSLMHDLAVTDLTIGGIAQPIAVATGRSPLTVVNPQTGGVLYNGPILDDLGEALTSWGIAIEAGVVNGRSVALVSAVRALGGNDHLLIVVDLSDPANPRAIGMLSLPSNPFGVDDILLRDTTAYVGTDVGTYVVSLADETQPRLISSITNVAGHLGMTDSNLLFGTVQSPTVLAHQRGGIRSAALGAAVLIQNVSPFLATVDHDGRTQHPIKVKYRLIAPPEDVASGAIHLQRDADGTATNTSIVGTYAMQQLGDGTYEVTIPPGVELSVPSETVEVRISMSDGYETSPFYAGVSTLRPGQGIEPPGSTDLDMVTPKLHRVSPSHAMQGALATEVTIDGTDLAFVDRIYVFGPGKAPEVIRPTSRTSAQLKVTIPASMFLDPAFLTISPTALGSEPLAFMVADPSLPPPGSGAMPKLEMLSIDTVTGGESVEVLGRDFELGMSIVLGRAGASGVTLGTELIDQATLRTTLPTMIGAAEDLFISVLAPDRQTNSGALPLRSVSADPLAELVAHYDATLAADSDAEPRVTTVASALRWNGTNQEIDIEGIGLMEDAEVTFSSAPAEPEPRAFTMSQGQTTSRTKRSKRSPSRPGLSRMTVIVPDAAVKHPVFSFDAKLTRSAGPTLNSAKFWIGVQPALDVPLGGRTEFGAFADNADENLYILALDGEQAYLRPTGRDLRRWLRRVPAALSVSGNPLKPSGLTVVTREKEVNKDGVLLLRGTGLTTLLTQAQIQANWNGLRKDQKIAVVQRALGSMYPTHDSAIIAVADKYGVPPQFLKSQALQESGNFASNFRYESLTRDFEYLTGDAPGHLNAPNGQRWTDTDVVKPYLIPGTKLESPTPFRDQRSFTNDGNVPDLGPIFELNARIMRGYGAPRSKEGLTGKVTLRPETVGPRVEAVITGGNHEPQTLKLVTNYQVWRKLGYHSKKSGKTPVYERGVLEPAHPIQQDEFSVDYRTGTVTIGRKLAPGEKLTIRYDPVDERNWKTISNSNVPTLDLNNKKLVRENIRLKYSPGESLFQLYKNNLQGSLDKNYGNFLTGTRSEQRLEFSVQPGTDKPLEPIDQRYAGTTAQPYAASSYGLLQVLLDEWLEVGKGALLHAVIDPKVNHGVFLALTDVKKGLELGAAVHAAEYARRLGKMCTLCTRDEWEAHWDGIVRSYNPDGNGYTRRPLTEIILRSLPFEPMLLFQPAASR